MQAAAERHLSPQTYNIISGKKQKKHTTKKLYRHTHTHTNTVKEGKRGVDLFIL